MSYTVHVVGRYSAQFETESYSTVRTWVKNLMAHGDVEMIRVFHPTGRVRTLVFVENVWKGSFQ